MSEKCGLLENCGFFKNFKGNAKAIHEGWILLYCGNKANSEKCKRKQIQRQTGIAPSDNMTPTGKLM